MKLLNICNRLIEYSFYALFLLVPLAFTSATSELFEMNKMWLTWGLTIVIAMAWFTKMLLQKKISVRRTPLDIPIGLFLFSQIISTIFSLDSHISLWGYYSRFNGGLLSIISYIFLYYAFLSNSPTVTKVKRLLTTSLISGLIVALWGFPSHFGYDPTCFIFRGTFDVSCWTADFLPKVRIFSTLGQPNWLAAYLAILIPISLVYVLNNWKFRVNNWKLWTYLSITILFYIDALFTLAQSGFIGIWVSLSLLTAAYFWMERKKISSIFSVEILKSPLIIFILGILFVTFLIGPPISQLRGFSPEGFVKFFEKIQAPKVASQQAPIKTTAVPSLDYGITKSGNIRLLVWEGAINAWKANPIFGTGVETFAFAYYKYKPVGQNLTSEWDFLYNKAHNEYLNYLATTGIFGLGTYLLMIGSFLFIGIRTLNSKHEAPNPKQSQNSNNENSKCFEYSNFKDSNLFRISDFEFRILPLALLASYISILITNFFGFSVVITNVYLFMIPAFVFVLLGVIKPQAENREQELREFSPAIMTGIFFIFLTSGSLLISLFRFWQADIAFALGYNLDRASEHQQGYPNLQKATQLWAYEPVFKDEFSLNEAIIAAGLVSRISPTDSSSSAQIINFASTLTQEAINTSNEIVSQHPNNVVFWKTRTKLFHTLSQVDSRYLPRAMDAIEKASLLAPNDANIWYNLGVLYGQNGNLTKGIEILEKTVKIKPNYGAAHYALGLFYHTASLDKSGKIVADTNLNQKAIAQMQYILDNITPQDAGAKKALDDWANKPE